MNGDDQQNAVAAGYIVSPPGQAMTPQQAAQQPQAAPAQPVQQPSQAMTANDYIQVEDPRTGMSRTIPNANTPAGAALIDQMWAAAGLPAGQRPLYAPSTTGYDAINNPVKLSSGVPQQVADIFARQQSEALANQKYVDLTWSRPVSPTGYTTGPNGEHIGGMDTREGIASTLGGGGSMGLLQADSLASHLQIGGSLDPNNAGVYFKGPTDYAVASGGAVTIGDQYSRAIATALQGAALSGIGNLNALSGPAIYANPETANLAGLEIMRQATGRGLVQSPDVVGNAITDRGGNTRASMFYAGEENKVAESYVDIASAYHHFGQDINQPIPPNPYEYRADLAVEFLKGQPQNSQYQFSPVSGEMSAQLPQVNGKGYGIQQLAWDTALNTDKPGTYGAAPSADFMQAAQYLGGATGQYGPYGALAGQKASPSYATLTWEGGLSPEMAHALPAPFLSTLPSGQGTMPTATPFVSTLPAGDKNVPLWEQIVHTLRVGAKLDV